MFERFPSMFLGGCFIGEGLAMTTSIDQRLNIWKFAREEGLKLVSSHTHNIADPTSLAAYNTRYDNHIVNMAMG